jgi:ABC-type antimicrobial peptide transport system permease subunit
VAALDPQLPVEDLHTLTDTIARNLAAERFVGALAVAFAAMATALAAMGLFGVVAYVLSRRRRELGVRLALGAAPLQLAGMLLAHIGRLGAIGLALGIVLAVIAGRLAQALLFGVQGSDPLTLVSAAVLLAAVGAAAMAAPALRIRRIDPAKVLREA